MTLAALAEALGICRLPWSRPSAYMDETHTPRPTTSRCTRSTARSCLALGEPLTTEQTVATTWQVALDQVRATPAAQSCSAYARSWPPTISPVPCSASTPRCCPSRSAGPSGGHWPTTRRSVRWGATPCVTVTADTLTVHRLVQTVVRASLSPEDQQQWAGAAVRLVAAPFHQATST